MKVKLVVGKDCPRCPIAIRNAACVFSDIKIIDTSTAEGQIEALNLMVSSTPMLIIDGVLFDWGYLRSIKSLVKLKDDIEHGIPFDALDRPTAPSE